MNQIDEAELERLVVAALAVQQKAYAPYSNFQVGAAILHDGGTITCGANVENASYGLTLCAERVAASAAVTSAHSRPNSIELDLIAGGVVPIPTKNASPLSSQKPWRAIAVASFGGVTPCGACRQFLMEFAPSMAVYLVDSGTRQVTRIDSLALLLPSAFKF